MAPAKGAMRDEALPGMAHRRLCVRHRVCNRRLVDYGTCVEQPCAAHSSRDGCRMRALGRRFGAVFRRQRLPRSRVAYHRYGGCRADRHGLCAISQARCAVRPRAVYPVSHPESGFAAHLAGASRSGRCAEDRADITDRVFPSARGCTRCGAFRARQPGFVGACTRCQPLGGVPPCGHPGDASRRFTSLRISVGTAIAVLFIAETFASSSGLGYFITTAWGMVDYPRVFAGILALAVLGIVLYIVFDVLERRLTRWK